MGVIYKLKDEVIEFIVSSKKENPKLGCRTLAEAASQKFQVEVSKSSVNAIIKNAQLSNGVGRPKVEGVSRHKFTIPQIKKDQIFKKALLSPSSPKAPKPAEAKVSPPKTSPAPKIKSAEEDQKPLKNKGLPLIPDSIIQEEDNEPAVLEDQKISFQQGSGVSKERGKPLPWAGLIFFKMALDECFAGQSLSAWAKKFCEPGSGGACEAMEAALFLRLVNLTKSDEIQEFLRSPWALICGFKEGIENNINSLLALPVSAKAFYEYDYDKKQIFLNIHKIKLNLADGTNIFLDPQGVSLWNKDVPDSLEIPLNSALAFLSKRLITNARPVILGIFEKESLCSLLFDFISSLENIAGKSLNSVDIYDAKDQLISSFSVGILRRKDFIVGLSPRLSICQQWQKMKTLASRAPLEIEFLNEALEFSQAQTAFLEHPHLAREDRTFKIVNIFEKGNDDPRITLLTNKKDLEPQTIARVYLLRYPNAISLAKTLKPIPVEKNKETGGFSNFAELIDDLAKELLNFCQRFYWGGAGQAEGDLSDLSGQWFENSDLLRVELSSKLKIGDEELALRVNGRNIVSARGQKYLINMI